MAYSSPATQISGQIPPVSWANSVKAALDYLASPPACRVYNSANESIASGAPTTVTFDTELFDTDSMHSTVSNTSRITINTAGVYIVTFHGYFQAAADYTEAYVDFYKNGNLASTGQSHSATTTSGAPRIFNADEFKLAVGDFLEAKVFQVNGAAAARTLNTDATAFQPSFSAQWMGLGT